MRSNRHLNIGEVKLNCLISWTESNLNDKNEDGNLSERGN